MLFINYGAINITIVTDYRLCQDHIVFIPVQLQLAMVNYDHSQSDTNAINFKEIFLCTNK